MRGFETLRADPVGAVLGGSALLTMVMAALIWCVPPLRQPFLARHQGEHFLTHVAGLPWPGMYSYVHRVELIPDGSPKDSDPGCAGPFVMTAPHMVFSTEVEMVRSLEVCGYESGTVRVESTDGHRTRTLRQRFQKTPDGWIIR